MESESKVFESFIEREKKKQGNLKVEIKGVWWLENQNKIIFNRVQNILINKTTSLRSRIRLNYSWRILEVKSLLNGWLGFKERVWGYDWILYGKTWKVRILNPSIFRRSLWS